MADPSGADGWGEPQDVLHTGKDLAVCKEVQRPARVWAKARRDVYKVREVNGQEEIELLADGQPLDAPGEGSGLRLLASAWVRRTRRGR